MSEEDSTTSTLTGLLRLTLKVSLASGVVSPETGIETASVVWPAGMVKTWLTVPV